jgi:hypothetical protein
VDVSPTVADNKALKHVDHPFLGCCQKQAWFWLPAVASGIIIVKTDAELVDRNRTADFTIDRFYEFSRLCAACDVGLIRDYNQDIPNTLEIRTRSRRVFTYLNV